MNSENSVTLWLDALRIGDQAAVQKLWERYFDRLVRLARRRLSDNARRVADEEDVALSAFKSFCLGAANGRYPQLNDRDALWRLLVTITARKAIDQINREHRQKRGGGRVFGESALGGKGAGGELEGLGEVLGKGPTPEDAAILVEEFQRMLRGLNDEILRRVALWKMEGYRNDEIAAKLGCARRTVARKLALIRKVLEERHR